jgi:anti-sigma regulatory factor (Ser/Thr protein kinase)
MKQRVMLVMGEGPESVGTARRQARSILGSWVVGSRAIDDVLLVLSELVTNAVLHAGQAQSAALVLCDDRVRVEVADRSRVAPSPSPYGLDAPTGRGLGLVQALSLEWGVAHQAQGKLVWADVALDDARALAVPAGAGAVRGIRRTGDVPRIARFLRVPVKRYLQVSEQNDALLRDVDLLLIGARSGRAAPVPDALLDACRRLRDGFANAGSCYRATVRAADAAGHERVDLAGPLPRAGARRAEDHVRTIEEIEAFAGDGHLLIEPPTAEVRGLRRWFVDQTVAQSAGRDPSPAE